MSKWIGLLILGICLLVLCMPGVDVPPQVQSSNLVMVVVRKPSIALLNDLHLPGVSVVSQLDPETLRDRFEMGQVIRRTTRGYEPYTLLIDGQCRLVDNWLARVMSCLAVAHTNQFSAITQMPAAKGPTFPVMEKSGYHAKVFVFPGRVYQSEVVTKRFLFGTSPIIKPLITAKNATLFANEHHVTVCNAVEWVVSGIESVETFGMARELDEMEKIDKFGIQAN
jgi:hypothetical protein